MAAGRRHVAPTADPGCVRPVPTAVYARDRQGPSRDPRGTHKALIGHSFTVPQVFDDSACVVVDHVGEPSSPNRAPRPELSHDAPRARTIRADSGQLRSPSTPASRSARIAAVPILGWQPGRSCGESSERGKGGGCNGCQTRQHSRGRRIAATSQGRGRNLCRRAHGRRRRLCPPFPSVAQLSSIQRRGLGSSKHSVQDGRAGCKAGCT